MERDGRILRNSRCRALTAVAVVLISSLATAGSARAAVTLAAGSASGPPGTTVSVPLTFGNDGTVAALQVDVGYDATVATAGNPTPGSALGGHRLDYAEVAPGLLRIVVTPPADNALLSSGELVVIPFQLGAAVPAGSYPVTLGGIVVSTAQAAPGQATATPGSLNVTAPNQPPVAAASAPPAVAEGSTVTLDGTASADPDGSITAWAWTQTAGPVVTVANAATAVASFTAPQVPSDTVLAFSLTVTDDQGATDSVSVTVTVTDVPAPADTTPPVVTAPPDVTVEATAVQTPVPLGTATATDDVDGILTPVPDNTGPFPLGTTTVTWKATDAAGNTGTAIQRVTVQDTTPPAIAAPPDIDVVSDVPIAVDPGMASASDIFPVTVANDAPATFPLGATTVTWTATDTSGNTATATQIVTVTPPPAAAWIQDTEPDGLVVIDASRFDGYTPQGAHEWVTTTTAGYTGAGALKAVPNSGTNNDTGYAVASPHLSYRVNFAYTGIHYVWIRGIGASSLDDSVHVGLDGQAVASADRISGFGDEWTWSNSTMDGAVATVVVDQPGVHTIDVWMREDGFEFDRILLTINGGYVPSATGPAASPYDVPPVTVAPPVPDVAPGRYEQPVTVSLSTTTPGAAIHYTLDGTAPTTASPVYTVPLAVNVATRIRARAFLDGARASPELDATWFIKGSVFQQGAGPDGLVSIEAAHYETNTPQGGHQWVLTTPPGHVGVGAMVAQPNSGTNNNSGYVTSSPHLTYLVNFNRTGTHYVWVRGLGASSLDDSVHVGLDGQAVASADRISGFGDEWTWSSSTMDGIVATIVVDQPGVHTIDVWMREDGFEWDKLVITSNSTFMPGGSGPAEAPAK